MMGVGVTGGDGGWSIVWCRCMQSKLGLVDEVCEVLGIGFLSFRGSRIA